LEVEHRDQIIRQLQQELAEDRREAAIQKGTITGLDTARVARDREIEHLKIQLDILKQDRDNIQRSWQTEQAQWRELWERGRESWEKERAQVTILKDQSAASE
jgi:hypothetical protein